MNMVISVVVSCLLNAPSAALPAQGVTSGQCGGFYIDKTSGGIVGNWEMQVNLQRNDKAPDGIEATKTAARVSMMANTGRQHGLAELEVTTLRAVSRTVALHSLSEFDTNGSQTLVF